MRSVRETELLYSELSAAFPGHLVLVRTTLGNHSGVRDCNELAGLILQGIEKL
jgi:hypothetical protein